MAQLFFVRGDILRQILPETLKVKVFLLSQNPVMMTVNVLATMVEPNNRRECLLAKIILAHHNTDNLHNWSYLIKIIHKCLKVMGPRQAQQLQQTDDIVQNVCDEDDSMAMMRMMVMMTMNEERVKAVRRLQQTDIDRCRPTECYSYTTPTLTIDGCTYRLQNWAHRQFCIRNTYQIPSGKQYRQKQIVSSLMLIL